MSELAVWSWAGLCVVALVAEFVLVRRGHMGWIRSTGVRIASVERICEGTAKPDYVPLGAKQTGPGLFAIRIPATVTDQIMVGEHPSYLLLGEIEIAPTEADTKVTGWLNLRLAPYLFSFSAAIAIIFNVGKEGFLLLGAFALITWLGVGRQQPKLEQMLDNIVADISESA